MRGKLNGIFNIQEQKNENLKNEKINKSTENMSMNYLYINKSTPSFLD